MPFYRFIEGDPYEDGTKETWYRHDEDFTPEEIRAVLATTWAWMKTKLKTPETLIPKKKLFTEAGFIPVKPQASVHLGDAHWMDEMTPFGMDQAVQRIGNRKL